MATTLTYGKATTCLLDSVDATLLSPKSTAALTPEQLVDQVKLQLAEPLDFPPLPQATIPGDTVMLPIGPGVPQLATVLDGVLRALRHAGVEDSLITILLADKSENAETLTIALKALGYEHCQIKAHNPDDEKEIAFLGVSQDGNAMRLNRELCDADFVLPIAVTTGELQLGAPTPKFPGLYPSFSDRETINQFASATAESYPSTHADSLSEIESCGRQLGVGLAVQVVPAPNEGVAAVLAGDSWLVAKTAQEKYREVWCSQAAEHGDLVIVTITGDETQQTWQNLGRALAAAATVLEPGSPIVVCSELSESVGQAVGYLVGNDDHPVIQREIKRKPHADSGPAMQISRTLQSGSIYLRSQLRASVVASMGIIPLESDSELERLVQSFRSCLVLEESQRLLPAIVEVKD